MKTAIELADAIDNSEETTGFERRCASMLRTLSQENEALKADAERYQWYVAQLESGNLDKLEEAFRNMERVEIVTKQMIDAAIDAMKGQK